MVARTSNADVVALNGKGGFKVVNSGTGGITLHTAFDLSFISNVANDTFELFKAGVYYEELDSDGVNIFNNSMLLCTGNASISTNHNLATVVSVKAECVIQSVYPQTKRIDIYVVEDGGWTSSGSWTLDYFNGPYWTVTKRVDNRSIRAFHLKEGRDLNTVDARLEFADEKIPFAFCFDLLDTYMTLTYDTLPGLSSSQMKLSHIIDMHFNLVPTPLNTNPETGKMINNQVNLILMIVDLSQKINGAYKILYSRPCHINCVQGTTNVRLYDNMFDNETSSINTAPATTRVYLAHDDYGAPNKFLNHFTITIEKNSFSYLQRSDDYKISLF